MAQVERLAPFIRRWEGGFADDPLDRGGATNMGVTLGTWRRIGYDKTGDGQIDAEDLKRLPWEEVVARVLKPHYWDRWRADEIRNQSLANLLVDWVWASGAPGIRIPQRMLGIPDDGVVGSRTLGAIHRQDPHPLFCRLHRARLDFVEAIVRRDPSQKRFLAGWQNRINALTFEP